jgi:F0F1-type ATP synthase membrane subunit c/vacuolar-type H+-ATPase subunit K
MRPKALPLATLVTAMLLLLDAPIAHASEANMVLPNLRTGNFLGMTAWQLLAIGLLVCAGGLGFGLVSYTTCRCTSRCARSPS